jgi:hypothetical protein
MNFIKWGKEKYRKHGLTNIFFNLCRFFGSSFVEQVRGREAIPDLKPNSKGGRTMRYMALWYPAENRMPASEKEMAEMGKLIGEMTKNGILVDTGGWDPDSPSTIIKKSGNKITVIDGPYTEAKEVVAGFAILEFKSKEEAVKWGKRFIEIAGEGFSEMRPLPGPPQKG